MLTGNVRAAPAAVKTLEGTLRVGRLLRTVSHLTPSQIWHRSRNSARRNLWARFGSRLDDHYRSLAQKPGEARFDDPGLARVAALRCARTDSQASLTVSRDALEGRFRFLGEARDMGVDVDWNRKDLDQGTRLWKTHLHEFDYAIDLARAARDSGDAAYRDRLASLITSWSAVSPIGQPDYARDVWNARAVANRIVNWAIAGSILQLQTSDPLHTQLQEQVAVHTLFLRDNLEFDLRCNHLLRDYVGLLFANALMGGAPEALEGLRAEVDEQVLADGCHIERSPLYHAVVLQDLIESRELLAAQAPSWLREAIARMAEFLRNLLPPSGDLPLFGDSWRGDIDPSRILEEAGESGAVSSAVDPDRGGGLIALGRGANHAVFRAGPHGPDYQLGHAHADGLSFELYRGPIAIICDTGTQTYDAGPIRQRLRSTAAHNTVQLDGEEQLEAWGSFRVGRRGSGRVIAWGSDNTWDWTWATHNGYQWLPGRPLHQRLFAVSRQAVIALDAVTGAGHHRIRSALHPHPDLDAESVEIEALRGTVEKTEVPLHEQFNESRQMTEWFVETQVELPWFGGWRITFEAGDTATRIELSETATGCVLEWGGATAGALSWNLKSEEVEFRPLRSAIDSAT
jgi:uncharacterized heparinase superfamily protein